MFLRVTDIINVKSDSKYISDVATMKHFLIFRAKPVAVTNENFFFRDLEIMKFILRLETLFFTSHPRRLL